MPITLRNALQRLLFWSGGGGFIGDTPVRKKNKTNKFKGELYPSLLLCTLFQAISMPLPTV